MRSSHAVSACLALAAAAVGVGVGCRAAPVETTPPAEPTRPPVVTRPDPGGEAPPRPRPAEPEPRPPTAPVAAPTEQPVAKAPPATPPAPEGKHDPDVSVTVDQDPHRIEDHAFPPTLSDSDWHRQSWQQKDCLRCHETGVQDAPRLRHQGMPPILLAAKCRTCHVFIPGSKPRARPAPDSGFADDAFPPMIPASASHTATWWKNDCLLCHEDGLRGAPVTRHAGMPAILLTAKCRTCHVQVRAIAAERKARRGH